MHNSPRVDLSQFYFQVSLKLYPKDGYSAGQPLPTATMARGLWFTMFNHVDPALVVQLHAPNAIRPYAIQRIVEGADVRPPSRAGTSGKQRRPFRSVTFTINLFREDILRVFQKYLLQLQDLAVPLGEYAYLAGEVGISRKSFLDLFPPLEVSKYSAAKEPPGSDARKRNLPKSYYVRFSTPEAVVGNLLRL